MKTKLLALWVLAGWGAIAQSYTGEQFAADYDVIINHLMQENWEEAYSKSASVSSQIFNDSLFVEENRMLDYILIYTTAGLLNDQKRTKDEALNQVIGLKGRIMSLPGHPFIKDCHVNCTHLSDDKENTFFTGVNNQAGTSIFSFEYVTIEGGIKETAEQLEGKVIALEGKLEEISVEGNMFPRFKLVFTGGSYYIMEP